MNTLQQQLYNPQNYYSPKKKKSGFTLIEVMVSVSIFTIIMLFGVGALVTVTSAHRASQQQKTAFDSLSFVMENMTRDIRTGSNYYADNNYGASSSGHSGDVNDGIADGFSIDTSDDRGYFIYYLSRIDGIGVLYRKVIDNSGERIEPLTSPSEINIDSIIFNVGGSDPYPMDNIQPSVIIDISGNLVSDIEKIFLFQTTISQRKLDL